MMNTACILLVFTICLPALLACPDCYAVWQLRNMIICNNPSSWPLWDYADYGCYCGKGGSGTPVDKLDTCCQVHDHCYSDAMQNDACWPIIDNPYTKTYSYKCDKASKTVTCSADNNPCEMFICECDRVAAACFATAGYNKEYKDYPSHLCK